MWEFWRSRMSKGKTRHRRRPESEGEELTRSPTAATNPPGGVHQPPENSTHVYFKDIILPASDDDDDAFSENDGEMSEDGSGAASAFAASESSVGRAGLRSAEGVGGGGSSSRLHSSAAALAAAAAAAAANPSSTSVVPPTTTTATTPPLSSSSNPTSQAPPPPPSTFEYSLASSHHRRRRARARVDRQKLIIILVGLPGRGKTFLCNKLLCYLNWLGHETRHFNVGQFRRAQKGQQEVQDASFFDRRNASGRASRERALAAALDEMERWLGTRAAQIAVFDATNSTSERRAQLRARFHGRWQYLFIESICNDQDVLEMNYRFKMMYSPDYASATAGGNSGGGGGGCGGGGNGGADATVEALADFRARIKKYEEVYETITDRSLHYIKLIDMVTGKGYMDVNRISGYIPGKIVFFLMQVCKAGVARVRKIWLTRHGESEYNLGGKLGGDSPLSVRGEAYARLLPDVIVERVPLTSDGGTMPVSVWTSTLVRTIQTAELLPFPKLRWKVLDEIQAGAFDGWTYAQIEAEHPTEFAARKRDKLRYRYPAGESYMDVVQRLEPAVIEVERERECVCVVAHQAILRALYGYFTKTPLKDIPRLEVPLHTLIELVPKPDGRMAEERVEVDVATGLASLVPPPAAHDPTAWTPWSPGSGGIRVAASEQAKGGGASSSSAAARGGEDGAAAATTAAAVRPPSSSLQHESPFGHASESAALPGEEEGRGNHSSGSSSAGGEVEVAASAEEEAAAALAALEVSGGELPPQPPPPPPRPSSASGVLPLPSPPSLFLAENSDAASAVSADAAVGFSGGEGSGRGGRPGGPFSALESSPSPPPAPSSAAAAAAAAASSSSSRAAQLLRRVPSLRGLGGLGRRGQSSERGEKSEREKEKSGSSNSARGAAAAVPAPVSSSSSSHPLPNASDNNARVGSSGNLIHVLPREPSATSSLPPPSLGTTPTGSFTTAIAGGGGATTTQTTTAATAAAVPALAAPEALSVFAAAAAASIPALAPGDRPPLYPAERTASGSLLSGGVSGVGGGGAAAAEKK